eukprot:5229645-Pyramimonas_sp.AAC.1
MFVGAGHPGDPKTERGEPLVQLRKGHRAYEPLARRRIYNDLPPGCGQKNLRSLLRRRGGGDDRCPSLLDQCLQG